MGLVVGEPSFGEDALGCTVEARLDINDRNPSLWFRTPRHLRPHESTIGDPFLAAMLPVAMAQGEDMVVEAPVSSQLLENVNHIQDIYAEWYPDAVQRIEITAAEAVSAPTARTGTLSTFTGGVDSFYTLVKHSEEIDAIVYVEGFDVPLSNMVLARTVRQTITSVAQEYGKESIWLASNLKTFTDRAANWGLLAHGPALASIGLLLQGHFDKMYIPSTHSLKQMFPWGSHVLVDHLWSTERQTFIHDGADASRVAKTAAISHEGPAQRNLRVCWQNKGPLNCGTCEKCLRTMSTLEILGALDDFGTFPAIDLPAAVRALRIANRNGLEFQLEILEYAHETGSTSETVPALQEAVDSFVATHGVGSDVHPPFAGGQEARQARLRGELTLLRRETARLRRENEKLRTRNAALKARVDSAERALHRRARRAAGRVMRRVGLGRRL